MFIADALAYTSYGCAVRCPAGHVKFTFKGAVGRGMQRPARAYDGAAEFI